MQASKSSELHGDCAAAAQVAAFSALVLFRAILRHRREGRRHIGASAAFACVDGDLCGQQRPRKNRLAEN
jgi:hypothetical protein